MVAGDDGDLWVVIGGNLFGGVLLSVRDSEIAGVRSLETEIGEEPPAGYPNQLAAAAPEGRIVLANRLSTAIWVLGLDAGGDRRIANVRDISDVTVADDSTVLVIDATAGEVVGYTPEGTTTVMVGTDPDATVRLDEPINRPLWLAALSGGRLAVVDETGDRRVLRLYGPDLSGEPVLSGEGEDELGPVPATPDERLLVTQGGERVVLFDLERPDDPRTIVDGEGEGGFTSVAAMGDDLVVLDDGRLWTVEDALR